MSKETKKFQAASSSEPEVHGKASVARKYEYLAHTADVKIHAWGDTQKEAFENGVLGISGYITELDLVHINPDLDPVEVQATGHDLYALLYSFLDECLFLFNTDLFVVRKCEIYSIIVDEAASKYEVRAKVYGETFNIDKHATGTEIKAITFNEMTIYEDKNLHHIEFVVDI
mmetsp:Transcript_5010/g.9173  ORF Transcript_5010/g.9173 Transcript_5010/m.9173 type:complete len:172 (+) Transcript_5010:56-571(+)